MRDITVFIVARFLSKLSDSLLLFAVPLIIYKSTGSVGHSGLAVFIEWTPRLFYFPIAGIFVDRFRGRSLYLVSDVVRFLACVAAFFCLRSFPDHTFAILSTMSAVLSVFSAQVFVALEAVAAQEVDAELLPKVQSLVQITRRLSDVLGPMLATFLSLWLPTDTLILAASGLFLGGFVTVCLAASQRPAKSSAPAENRSALDDILLGFRTLAHSRGLQALTLLTILVNLIYGLGLAIVAHTVTHTLAHPDSSVGVVNASVGIAAVGSAALVPWLMKRFSAFQVGWLGFFLIVMGTVVTGSATTFPQFVVGYVLFQGVVGLYNVFLSVTRAKLLPKETLGRTLGVLVLTNQVSLPLSGLLVALSANYVEPLQLLLWVGGLSAVLGYAALSMLRGEHDQSHLSRGYVPLRNASNARVGSAR